MNGYYGFIYLTINLINGKMYIGKKKYSGSWKKYLGSGKHFKNAVNYYGRENFVRLILENCKTKKDLTEKEKEYINEFNAVNDDMFYNIAEGEEGGNESINAKDRMIKVIVDNSIIFDSIQDAAKYIGCSTSAVSAACKKYHEVLGREVWFVDDLNNYKPLEYFRNIKSKNNTCGQLKRNDKNKIILMPEKRIFKDINECLEFTKGTKTALWNGLYNHPTGFHYMGYELIWEYNINIYKTYEERKAEEFINRSNAKKKIK